MRLLQRLLVLTFALLLVASPAWAQLSTAQLSGRVTDDSDAVLPGVSVTATQTDTGLVRSTVTSETGTYVLTNLPTGPYRLEVMLQGFRTYVQSGIVLQVAAAPVVNVSLQVGGLEETVSVEAATPLVDVQSAGIGDVVDNERIVELPLQGRQVTDLLVLAGAAVQTGVVSNRLMNGGVRISVAGGSPNGVAYVLDGANHNNPQSNSNLPLPFPDALQEFRVATSGLSAQNGMHGAAAVNAVTKSGTNNFHGNAFEFLRHSKLNAKSSFAGNGPDGTRLDDGLKRNQFGGTFGGPIMRDRLFFFGGYQGTELRVRPANRIANVPTPAMLAGDFTAVASPACNGGRQINLGAGFVGNRISAAQFSPAALKLAARLPSTSDPCGLVTFATTEDSGERQPIGRVDYQRSSNHSLFGRYLLSQYKREPAYEGDSDNVLKTVLAGTNNVAHALTVGDTNVLGPNVVNSLRVAFNRTTVDRYNTPYFDPVDLGIKLHPYIQDQMPVTVVGGFAIAGSTQTKGLFTNRVLQVADDVTLVRGRHQFAFGTNISYAKGRYSGGSTAAGNFNFDGRIAGLGLADFLLGRVARIEHGSPSQLPVHHWYVGVYGQDAWRLSDRVTFNLGVRWEPYLGQAVESGALSNFSLENFRQGIESTVFINAPAGLIYPGDPGFPDGKTGMNKQWWNFSPRAGVAWDVTGDGRMALRASYALAYDFAPGEFHNNNVQSPPFANASFIFDPPGRLDDPYAHLGGDPHPITPGPASPYVAFGTFGAIDADINSPRVQNWNVTIERQFGSDWGLAASYLGSYSDRLWNTTAINPGVYLGLGPCTLRDGVFYPVCSTAGNLNVRRVLYQQNPQQAQFLGAVDRTDALGWQEYHGLKLSATRRAVGGLSLNGSYTLSRCVGTDTPDTFTAISNGYVRPGDPEYDRGFCDHDHRHLATLTLGAESPEMDGALGAVASNWRASGILTVRDGNRINIITGTDDAYTGIMYQRPNKASDQLYASPRTLDQYFNSATFVRPEAGGYGNLERNAVKGPNYWNVDLAVSREVSLGGRQVLELRLETFNLLNTFNWGDPAEPDQSGGLRAPMNSARFGRVISQAGAPRILQLGFKYAF